MKDLDTTGAPMISVPAGVLKEFMSPANSRTPTPPLTASTSTTVVSEVVSASSPNLSAPNNTTNSSVKSRTPTPTPTSRTSSPALSLSKEKSSVTLSSVSVHVNGKVELKDEDKMKDETKFETSSSAMNGVGPSSPQLSSQGSTSSISTTSSTQGQISTGVKRDNDDDDGKPDLKKIRLVSSGFKNVNITVKEVNKALDMESKKLQDMKKINQNLVTVSRISNGISSPSGEKHSPADSPCLSPSATVIQEGGDFPIPNTLDQGATLTKEQNSSNKENHRSSRGKETRLTKNGLKDAILRVFSDNTLYGSEVGHLKQMCEKLASTLEINMRKVAQFHKEIEDLRKVTTRLAAEHQARKGQYVAPIRIKRSVGIQAAPHIINKGIMHASMGGGNIKTISPRTPNVVGVIPSSMGQNLVPASTLGIITTSTGVAKPGSLTSISAAPSVLPGTQPTSMGTAVRTPSGHIMVMAPAATMQPLARPATGVNATAAVLPASAGRVVRAPLGNLGSVTPQAGTLIGSQRPILIQNDKTATVASALHTTQSAGRSGGVIDLTDEDEGSKGTVSRSAVVPKPGALVKVPTTATAQFVPLPAGGVGQVVLLPNTNGGQPTALIVSQVSNGQPLESIGNPAVAQARISTVVNHTSSTNRLQGSTPPAQTRTAATTASTTTIQQPSVQLRHPAPLPKTSFQQVGGISKKLPPQPTLKLSHKDSSIVLSWTMAKTEDHETIASYQLYAYQEGAAPPSANLWKKVGSVKALELPMACTLTQFMPGHMYHFAVRAVDTKSRLGPFSEPRSIKLDKK